MNGLGIVFHLIDELVMHVKQLKSDVEIDELQIIRMVKCVMV
jgi:hypothetical protein